MALDRHDLGVHLVVHPIVRVLRTTAANCLLRDGRNSHDGAHPLLESWTHFEIDRNESRHPRVGARTSSACRDVRIAPRTGSRCSVPCSRSSTSSSTRPRQSAAESTKEKRCCAGSPISTSPSSRTAVRPARRRNAVCVPDTARVAAGRARRAVVTGSTPGAKAHERTLLVLTKANARSTVHRPTYLDYVGISLRRRRHRDRRAPLPRPLHSSAYTALPGDVPVLRRVT